MSGLIDTIVRRRRASASSRLGPPAHLLDPLPGASEDDPRPLVNGHPPPAVNGHAPEPAAQEPVPAPSEPEVEDGRLEAEAEPEREAEAEPEPDPEAESEPDRESGSEPEPATTTFAAIEPEPVAAIEPAPLAPLEPAAPLEPVEPPEYPSLRERAVLRRRARHLASVREVQLRDLGGFLLELHRFGRSRPDLVQAKLAAAATTDSELRSLHHRLDQDAPVGELRRPGIGGACERCGAVHGSLDRFCASCGEPVQ